MAIMPPAGSRDLTLLPFESMKRKILILGIVGGFLISLLRWSEYRFLVIEHSFEIYGALIAIVFAALGIWLGLRFMGSRNERAPEQPAATGAFTPDIKSRDALGITRRELEILELVAQGMSNREIAGKLFVSENTVKTHCSRSFDKLGAKRRTQAVQRAKELRLLR